MATEGSLEVLVGGKSSAQRVRVTSLESVPAILANNFGVSGATETTAVIVGTVTSAGAWTGTKDGNHVEARLWQDIPFEETAVGKALASGAIDPLNPDGGKEG